jgi:hypothetical protein
MTNGDMLVTGAGGAKGIIIMATDYSNGNDQIVAKPGRIVKGFFARPTRSKEQRDITAFGSWEAWLTASGFPAAKASIEAE